MFGEKRSVHLSLQLYKKTVSAFLIFSFSVISLTSTVRAAANGKTSPISKRAKRIPADVKLDGFLAETFAGATKISWKTSFEQNLLGFKVWRDDGGQRVLVTPEPVAGSLLKVGNGILPAGSEYNFYDQTASTNVYYWLEAVDINAQSRWFGPVYPEANFEETTVKAESAKISQLNTNADATRWQTEKVEFSPRVSRKLSATAAASAAVPNDLVTTNPESLKIEVRSRGIYRIEAQALAEMGYGNVTAGTWKLFMGGVEQPMVVNADGSMEFFGQGIDTIQTDANVYWLMPDTTAGQRINRIAQNFQQSARDAWTRVTAERRDKTMRISSILNGARENWFGAVINNTAATQTLTLNDVALTSGQTATVGIDLQGVTAYPHQISVLLNGVSIGQIAFSAHDRIQWTVNVPLTSLLEGANTITMQSLSGSSDVSITEAVRISYPRNLKARNDRLDFSVDSNQSVKLKGFSNSQVRVFDVTNPTQIVEYAPESRQETDGTYSVTVASSPTPRIMLAQAATAQAFSATPLITNNASNLRSTQNAAKMIVIAPLEFRKLLQDFIWMRNFRGVQTIYVDVQDIYDEFNNGVRSAESIRTFLQYAKQNWTVKPDFVILAGDATVDPRNYSGQGGDRANKVPTMLIDTWNLETVSDEMMVDFNGDNVGEIAVGRLPAENEDEIEAMTEKILLAEPVSAQEINARGVHFVSDGFVDYNFPGGSRNMATFLPPAIRVNYLDAAGQDPATVRSTIISRISSGPAIVNYFGHASIGAWTGSQIFRNVDAQNLTNHKRAPFMAMINCMNGDFAETSIKGVAESVMKKWRGGANSVWAASGWNGAFEQEYMTRDFYRKAFTGMPLGEAARQTKLLYPGTDLRRTYVFFGDPSQSLVTP